MSNPLALVGRAATYLLLIFAAFLSVFPFLWMAIGATNTSADVIKGKATPGSALWTNMVTFFTSVDMPRILVTIVGWPAVGSHDDRGDHHRRPGGRRLAATMTEGTTIAVPAVFG